MSNALLEMPKPELESEDMIEEAVLWYIDEQAVVGLDALIRMLPQFSWNQIFHAVDRLARSNRIVLRRHRFDYTLFSAHFAA